VKLRLIAVGKIREPYIAAALADFRRRLERYHDFEEVELAASRGGDAQRAMHDEGERVARALAPGEPVWLLDRGGVPLTSIELSERIVRLADSGHGRLTFIVAGTYGADRALLERADLVWSLSTLTFLHEWARAIVVEQLYRAAKIARKEPYHY
jgi:23S rRNA (pseudouridine1915-N3)-methyltransferase